VHCMVWKRFDMNTDILISVIIPTYNRAEDLKRSIGSVLRQTYPHFEIVVVDNHSTDHTDEVISSFQDARIRVLKIHNNGIIAASRNMGVQNAKGEYVAFLDSDDWWDEDKLALCVAEILKGADFVYHDLMIYLSRNRFFKTRKRNNRTIAQPVFNNLLRYGNPIYTSSVVVKKQLVVDVGFFDETPGIVAIEDFDLWLKIARVTEKFAKVQKNAGWYWYGSGNTSSPQKSIVSLEAFYQKYEADIVRLNYTNDLDWFQYTMGSAKYRLAQFIEAKGYFNRINLFRAPVQISIKTMIRYCMMLMKQRE